MECGKMFMIASALMFLLLAGLAGHGFALPSTSSSSERTTVKSFSSAQTSSSSFSQIITTTTTATTTSSSSPTTATTTAATTTEEQDELFERITTTLPPPSTKKVVAAVEEHGSDEKTKDESSDNTKTIVIACCCVGGILLLVILIVGAYYIYRWCLKKRAAKKTQSGPNAQHPDGTSKADIKPKNPHTPEPAAAVNPWAPEHVSASTFDYKGPLVLQTRPPQEIPMVHELDNEQPPSFHESHHVQFDDTQNVVVEIGSEVEVFMDGEKQLPKKARSSLPSPYAESGGKAGGASGGGKGKKKMSEKQKDKAIRE